MSELRLRALEGLPEIPPGDDLPARLAGLVPPGPGILVVAQKIVSKAEGRLVSLADIVPSPRALELAAELGKEPRHTELVLREAKRVVRTAPGVLITETRHGLVCANSGVDLSNSPGDEVAVLLPLDPDASAERIRAALGPGRAVIISDTFGRPWREGLTNVAIGLAGFAPIRSYLGERDPAGRPLQATILALADELAGAAEPVMGKLDRVPAAIIRGLVLPSDDGSGSKSLLRDPARDLFR